MRKRLIILSVVMALLLSSITGRIGYIIFSKDYIASESYNSYVLKIATKQPTLYYRDYNLITNNKSSYVAIIRPNAKCIGELIKIYNYTERQNIIEELRQGLPVLKPVSKKYNCRYIQFVKVDRTSHNLNQLINKTSNGVLNHIENPIGEKRIKFSVSATGKLLDGDEGQIVDDNYDTPEGYRLSIDKHIQNIVVDSTRYLTNGCVLVMNVEDASILAMVNKPSSNYNIKAFSKYSVGSVFKIVVSLCAIENDVDIDYTCNSKIVIGDTTYNCHNNNAHGKQNLKLALANSCNCYFVKLANELGKVKLLDTCNKLGFNDNTVLFDKWEISNANMPTNEDLSSKGELSLFGFGQGKLSATPLQIGSVLCTIGNYGMKQDTKLFLSNINKKKQINNIQYNNYVRFAEKENCKTLINYLNYVVTDGTGKNANTGDNLSAGKTATAQTGQYVFGREKLNTWFAGLYPSNNPKYAIVILNENGTSGSKDCCPIFRTIIEQL